MGVQAIPEEWIKCVDDATAQEKQYMVSDLTIKETSQGLYDALQEQIRKQKERIRLLEGFSE